MIPELKYIAELQIEDGENDWNSSGLLDKNNRVETNERWPVHEGKTDMRASEDKKRGLEEASMGRSMSPRVDLEESKRRKLEYPGYSNSQSKIPIKRLDIPASRVDSRDGGYHRDFRDRQDDGQHKFGGDFRKQDFKDQRQ
jgi:hypothetical protein